MKSYGIILFTLVCGMVSAAPATDATFKQTSRDEILRRKVMRALAHERGPSVTYDTCSNSPPYSSTLPVYATFSEAHPSVIVSSCLDSRRAHTTDETTADRSDDSRRGDRHGLLRQHMRLHHG
jgi:hypothetical protein